MLSLFIAVMIWVVLSVIATPLIGRFLVMRESTEEQDAPEPTSAPGVPSLASAAFMIDAQHTTRRGRVRMIAR